MPENCDPACVKNIINTRLIAYIATNLAETAGKNHPLYRPARILAAASRATCEAYAVAIEEGTLTRTSAHSGWNGCEDAEFLNAAAKAILVRETIDARSLRTKMDALTDKANSITARLVHSQKEST